MQQTYVVATCKETRINVPRWWHRLCMGLLCSTFPNKYNIASVFYYAIHATNLFTSKNIVA